MTVSHHSGKHCFVTRMAICFLCGFGWFIFPVSAGEPETTPAPFRDEPAAHAIYDRMIKAMWKAESLSYVIHSKRERRGKILGDCVYRVWLKKPNYFRVELQSGNPAETGGALISDGDIAWIHWPEGRRPRYYCDSAADGEIRPGMYMRWPSLPSFPGVPPIRYCIANLQAERSLPILDPNIFHFGPGTPELASYTAEPYLEGFKSMGTEKVGSEMCDKIGVSFRRNHRTWYLWLSRRDHLPRRLEETVRYYYHRVNKEEWSLVTVNGDIPETTFAWKPPEGWDEWKPPSVERGLLKPGTKAPDFELASADGTRIRLSDYRGRVVWLYSWSAGCPPCRKGMVHHAKFYEQFKDKGLVLLGFNCMDDKKIALDLMREYGVTFPNVLDSSDAAVEAYRENYGGVGVPLNYIIDRDGMIVNVWYGYREDDPRPMEALIHTGDELGEAVRRARHARSVQTAKEVAVAAQRLFEAIRAADYDHDWISTGDWKRFPAANVNYSVERNYPAWVRWVCTKFKANPITKVQFGKVFTSPNGLPTVHYRLRLEDGEILEGDLPFKRESEGGEWVGRLGLDWHLGNTK